MHILSTFLKNFLSREDGPTAVEYAVMLALIVAVCVGTIGTLGINSKQVCTVICTVVYGNPPPP